MKRIGQMVLVFLTCTIMNVVSINSAQAASAQLDPTQEQSLKAILRGSDPGLTEQQLNQLVRNPDFIEASGTVVSVEITPVRIEALRAVRATTGTRYCTWAWSQVKARGLFGTLFSFKVQLDWCYDYNRVSSPSYSVTPDVTMYGSTLGWSYRGERQARNTRYYRWKNHRQGGYVAEAFGEFSRCLGGNVGCIDQRFTDVGVFGHYDGTYTARNDLN